MGPVPVCASADPSAAYVGWAGGNKSGGRRPRRKLEQHLGGEGGAWTRSGPWVLGDGNVEDVQVCVERGVRGGPRTAQAPGPEC